MSRFQRPRGTRDFGPGEMAGRRWAESRMREAISTFGYREISTPTFEHTDLFVARSGPQVVEQMYSFEDKGGRELSLRPELTAPVMRFYHSDLRNSPKPLRIFYFGNCFRYERPQKGRYREFWQIGLEYIGPRTPLALAEVVSAAILSLEAIGMEEFVVRIGHVSLLSALLRGNGADPAADRELMTAIDKKDTASIRSIMEEKGGADPEELIGLVSTTYDVKGYKKALDSIVGLDPSVKEEASEAEAVMELVGRIKEDVRFDPSISRGLDYYDGIVFEIDAPGLGAEKQICGGGAYSLSSVFGSEVEGIGFGLGFDRILVALKEVPSENGEGGVYLIPIGEGAKGPIFELSAELRRLGRTCITETSDRSFKKAIGSAVASGCTHLIMIGDNEINNGTVSVKDLRTKEQREVPFENVIGSLDGS